MGLFRKKIGLAGKELAEQISGLGVEDNVILIDQDAAPSASFATMPMYYNMAAVTLSVPSWDGGPTTILEAMACHSPLVLSDIPENREWIINDKNGYLVTPGDEVALAEAIVKMLDQPKWLEESFRLNREAVALKAEYVASMSYVEKIYLKLSNSNN